MCSAGISSDTVVRPSSVSQEELLELIDKMNRDWRVSGLLVQLPLPGEHMLTVLYSCYALISHFVKYTLLILDLCSRETFLTVFGSC